MTTGLEGCRVLVIEDEPLVYLALESILSDLGCEAIGVPSSLDEALDLAASEADLSAALLDVNIWGGVVFPVAEVLRSRGVEVIFCSGMSSDDLPEQWRSAPRLQKPYGDAAVRQALTSVLDSAVLS